MTDIFIYVYILNLTLLILHEVDSAYWQEWNLFNLGGGIDLFLALHFPLIAIALYGLLILPQKTIPALGISMILGLAGIGALIIHSYLRKQKRVTPSVPFTCGKWKGFSRIRQVSWDMPHRET